MMTSVGEQMVSNGCGCQTDSVPSLESKRPLENRAITEALQKLGNQISLLKNQLENQKISLNILAEYGKVYQLQSSCENQGVVHFNFGIEVEKVIPPYTSFAETGSTEGSSTPLILTEIHQAGTSYAAYFNSESRTITSMAGNIPVGHYFVKS